jgi:hypothetical protein
MPVVVVSEFLVVVVPTGTDDVVTTAGGIVGAGVTDDVVATAGGIVGAGVDDAVVGGSDVAPALPEPAQVASNVVAHEPSP